MFIAGNWKSNKTIGQAQEWFKKITIPSGMTVVLCAPYTVLGSLPHVPFSLGAQNVSMYDEGAYTGEVTATMIKEVEDWVIIGHSERRTLFSETDEMLAVKAKKAHEAGLKVIYCVSDENMAVPDNIDVLAYEPLSAIGTGKPMTPKQANDVIYAIKQKKHVPIALYGGSVTSENVSLFVEQNAIDGVLVGGVSLDAENFSRLLYETKNSV